MLRTPVRPAHPVLPRTDRDYCTDGDTPLGGAETPVTPARFRLRRQMNPSRTNIGSVHALAQALRSDQVDRTRE